MTDCKLEVVSEVIKVHRAETWKDKTQFTPKANQCLHYNEWFPQMPRKANYFSLCLHGIGNSFLFRVSKSHNYTSPILFVWTMISSLMVLEDSQIHLDFFLTLSASLSQLPCVFASKGLHWDPKLLKLACMQHREPVVTGMTCQWWACVRVWKTSSLALNWHQLWNLTYMPGLYRIRVE